MKCILICLFPFVFFGHSLAQENSITLKNPSLQELFNTIEANSDYRFAYDSRLNINGRTGFSITISPDNIEAALTELERKSNYMFRRQGQNITVKHAAGNRQETHTLSGTISNEQGQPLQGANIIIKEKDAGIASDRNGRFSIPLQEGVYTLRITYVGHLDTEKEVGVYGDVEKHFTLMQNGKTLDEVTVTGKQKQIAEIKKPQMSVNSLSVAQIKRTPVVLGEADPIKSLMQLPGVTNAGEGSSGFNVRGGAADQNLLLLDGAPIYGDSHLFGFFSVFNADALSGLELYKGGIPSKFGGRVSSILDARQRIGDNRDFHMNGGIGLISSRLTAEGPLEKDRGSFMLAGRSSYAHLFLKLAGENNSGYFYDLNTRLNYRLNENNSLYLSGYYGRDVFDINDLFSSSYGNAMLNLRWRHRFSDNLEADLITFYSDYRFGLELAFADFLWDNAIESYGVKYDFSHRFSDAFSLQYGAGGMYYDFNPGTLAPSGPASIINFTQLDKKYALEPSVYVDAEHTLSDKLTIRYGLRYSLFYRYGQETVTHYADNRPVAFNPVFGIYERGTPVGSTQYGRGEQISSFNNLEPRVALSYALDDNTSLKASYNRMTQYLHLLANTQSPTPVNVWTPSGPYTKPQLLDQVALGYFKNFSDDRYTIETEAFYKTVDNRIDYVDGAELIANNHIEQVILNGEARSLGWEFLLRKNTGKLTGWIAYTLSRAEQRTPGHTPEEPGIAGGNWYLSPYDKLHNLVITGVYELNDRWSFAANFALQSGQPVTFPDGQYRFGGLTIPSYGSRNDSRLPTYHHLDVAATYIPRPRKQKSWRGEWVFSIYNVYNRMNAASIRFGANEETGINEATRLSIFGIIPGVSYNFKF
ncbi:Outer membrane receptor proteins, mostly Fe transport [Parapedobacter composti]|uniref:Outer membrane receptor proteins, mostly Fe transport n=1 Tax=Parapedobacter composti TaxID=623281 RepID=A0A1I1M7H2_9SPHI|nr:TonB-dependent receptor [Parapedobacter composti]SFC78523.1 Outer membrane receptor proteins, mostly Fe transport [Parapedobacter composti]